MQLVPLDGFGFVGSFAREDGVIISHTGKERHGTMHRDGRFMYLKDRPYGRNKFTFVHKLIALAFVPNPNNWTKIKFKDGDKGNPRSSNLEWAP